MMRLKGEERKRGKGEKRPLFLTSAFVIITAVIVRRAQGITVAVPLAGLPAAVTLATGHSTEAFIVITAIIVLLAKAITETIATGGLVTTYPGAASRAAITIAVSK